MRVRWMVAGVLAWAACAAAADWPSSEADLWEAASGLFRKRPLEMPGETRRTAITIEAGERWNPFMLPGGVDPSFGGGRRNKAKRAQGVVKDVKPFLDDLEGRIASAEKAFGEERFHDLPPKAGVEEWVESLEGVKVSDETQGARRADLVSRAQALAGKMAAREAFLQRGYQVQFVVVHETAPERSVACVNGNILRTRGVFDDGVVIEQVRKDGVRVSYQGMRFDLPLLRAER